MPEKKRVYNCRYIFKSGPLEKELDLLCIVPEGSLEKANINSTQRITFCRFSSQRSKEICVSENIQRLNLSWLLVLKCISSVEILEL